MTQPNVFTQLVQFKLSPKTKRWLERSAMKEEISMSSFLRRLIARARRSESRAAKASEAE